MIQNTQLHVFFTSQIHIQNMTLFIYLKLVYTIDRVSQLV